jgi:hypothetical protein
MSWEGPRYLKDWLSQPLLNRNLRPPETAGIYIVTERSWNGTPDVNAGVLYVGQTRYLRDRVGRLIAEILGFTTEISGYSGSYYHNGGHCLWTDYCLKQNVEPLTLHVGWLLGCHCLNCAESELIKKFNPICNSQRGNLCHDHVPPLNLGIIVPAADANTP